MKTALRAACLLFLACLAGTAAAACSRPIVVPMAPLGVSVIADGDKLDGIYPRLLRTISEHSGCIFRTSVVPQARLEAMFAAGQADLMIPVTGTPWRDQNGVFLPLMETRAMLVTLDRVLPGVNSTADLLRQKTLRIAIVRGNDYGDGYQAAVAALSDQQRLLRETDAAHVARLMAAGLADATLITPLTLAHAIKEDPHLQSLLPRLHVTALPELPWRQSGAYVSLRSLSGVDREFLLGELRHSFSSDAVMDTFRRYYPAELIAVSARRHQPP